MHSTSSPPTQSSAKRAQAEPKELGIGTFPRFTIPRFSARSAFRFVSLSFSQSRTGSGYVRGGLGVEFGGSWRVGARKGLGGLSMGRHDVLCAYHGCVMKIHIQNTPIDTAPIVCDAHPVLYVLCAVEPSEIGIRTPVLCCKTQSVTRGVVKV